MKRLLATAVAAVLTFPAAAAAQYPYSQEPLHDPIAYTPARPRASVLLVHAGGWAGPDRRQQDGLWQRLAPALTAKGYRVVAIDYGAGAAGALEGVVRAVDDELAAGARTVCLYGESAGGHLALLAAELEPAVDCVATYAAPTDFGALRAAADAHPEMPGYAHTFHDIVAQVFGSDPAGWVPWEPSRHAGDLEGDLLMMRSADDPLIPPDQVDLVADQVPTARTYEAPAGDVSWVHGTVASTQPVFRRVVDLVDRAIAVRKVQRAAAATGCDDATDRLVTGPRFRRAAGCLLSTRVRAGSGSGVRVSLVGPVTPATVADAVTRSRAARRILRDGAVRLTVTPGAPTRIRVAHGPPA